ncbi:hypothetical protein NB717_003858 [Xanthomonas sacchari]|uniref:hypothetical protein n=1 Tax=Xanthomonas sacchari TaxID=56458 RepID=UPI0031C03F77|nr:hypothetical protein [Xanthomonas sacchari]
MSVKPTGNDVKCLTPGFGSATRRRGYTFIGLDEALRDPAYTHAEGYTGPGGIS